jgi:hypothetical protein
MRWRSWQPTKKSVEQPDGHTVIYTEVLSTTGIPVQIAIPVKSPKEIAEMLLREIMPDSGQAPHKTEVEPERLGEQDDLPRGPLGLIPDCS